MRSYDERQLPHPWGDRLSTALYRCRPSWLSPSGTRWRGAAMGRLWPCEAAGRRQIHSEAHVPPAGRDMPAMANDMVCHCLEGELQVTQGPGKQFLAKTGDVWSCIKGMPEANVNNGTTIAIMRVIDLIPPA